MTIEELKDIPFHFVAHMALESEHMMSYETEDKVNKVLYRDSRDPYLETRQ